MISASESIVTLDIVQRINIQRLRGLGGGRKLRRDEYLMRGSAVVGEEDDDGSNRGNPIIDWCDRLA